MMSTQVIPVGESIRWRTSHFGERTGKVLGHLRYNGEVTGYDVRVDSPPDAGLGGSARSYPLVVSRRDVIES
jgi:hypothetical protein